jgi:hypothetical protein
LYTVAARLLHAQKIALALRSNAAGNIKTESVTPHLSTNETRIHQKLVGNNHVYEKIRKEKQFCSTVVTQHC